ncbi:phenylacetate--CoA ligase family protein [Spiribacter halobius]|uniref:Capsule biosynthesis protein CapK n=1 Tax=Sediminicurvatus halobius TaxID=2182432 RepID=A0A2U2N125_9GAMM|nr:phenylacetate--CoA ligase family protein [Spiribacter halobius]PWG62679.1 capsule biosynthesis protein CapK [Spiribacter halobius]UEX77348.1 phenylacetate--CoA ligase family protein [Spiribacter halobius]
MSVPNVAIPPAAVRRALYPLHERLLRRPTFAYLAELEAGQWQSRAVVEARQAERLGALLRVAHAHCPWHRERMDAAGLEPGSDGEPVSLETLRRLPPMTKADARAAGDAAVWHGVPGGAQRSNTGGSSGEPLIFRFGRRRQASDAAGRMRARRWWGVEVGEREVYLWGSPVELGRTDRIKTLRDRLFNQLVLNAFDMSPQTMDDYIAAIRAFRPACVYGYASSIALLAAHARERGTDLCLPGLRVVCTTGEPLFAHQRELIGEVFGVPVANEFGSRDIGFTAHESPAGQMLLCSESIILEVLDPQGEPVAPGEVGEAVMTGLCSEAQPFLRYRTGDMVRVSGAACREGRGLHVIDEVVGRSTDFVVRADGAVMHALSVIYVLRDLEGIAEFRFIQHRVDEAEILVVPGAGWDATTAEQARNGLRARLGREVRVRICEVDAIPPEASGKYRYVVSHVPLPGALRVAAGGEGQP